MASESERPATTRKLSFQKILAEWEQFALKNLLNLKHVIPTLVQKQVVSPRVGSALEKNPRKFLGFLKAKSVGDFASFCEALAESFPVYEDHVKLVRVMSSSLERLNVPQGSETFTRIQRVIEEARNFTIGTPTALDIDTAPPSTITSVAQDSANTSTELEVVQESVVMETASAQSAEQLQSVPSELSLGSSLEPVARTSVEVEQVQSSLPRPLKPPKGFVLPARSQRFSREEGGTLYCPAHDVKLSVPPLASPSGIPEFVISMHAYVEGPFEIAEDFELCMPVIWLGLYPQFTFEKPVTLKLPHSAIIDDASEYMVLRASEDPSSETYKFTEELKADFSDGYHAVVELDHFCAVTGGRRRKRSSQRRKRTGSKGGSYKRTTRASSDTRRAQSSTPELRKQATPELVRLLTSTSSAAISPQSSLASTSLSFEGSFESPLPQSSVDSHDLPPQNYSCSHDQTVGQFAGDTADGPFRSRQTCQTSSQGQFQYGGSHPHPAANQAQSQPTVSSPDPSLSGRRSSALHRQKAFDEGGGEGLLATQESSGEGNSSCNSMTMAMCTTQVDEEKWRVAFLASLCHPTGLLALRQVCEEMETQRTIHSSFRPVSDCLVFEPQCWERGGWIGQAISNARIGVDKVSTIISQMEEQRDIMAPLYPPRVTYDVCRVGVSGSYLGQRINVRGADAEGEELFFCLCPLSSGRTASSRRLNTWPELYTQSSVIPEALSSTRTLLLEPSEPDHIKLLADLSFQLTRKDLERLPNLLEIDEPKKDRIIAAAPNDLAEHAFQFLLSWVASHHYRGSSSWNQLFSILQTLGITGVDVVEKDGPTNINRTVHQRVINDNLFITQLSEKLGLQWKFVGRFLGLSNTVIDQCEQAVIHGNDNEPPFQMLYHWIRRRETDSEATYGALFRALCRVLKYKPAEISGAYVYVERHIMNLGN